ncbi:MAG: Calx-beta domain-containing protein, partial [Geminicoccaceae bacterium]
MVDLGRFAGVFKPVGLAVLIGGVASTASADSFYLKNGDVIEGTILKGTFNTLTLASGSRVQPTSISLIERVVMGLADGSEVSGRPLGWKDGVLELEADGRVFRVADGEVIQDEPESLQAEAASDGSFDAAASETIAMKSLPRFTLKNGSEIVGRILHATGSIFAIRPEGGATAPMSKADVEFISFEDTDGRVVSGELLDWKGGVYRVRLDDREFLANLSDDVAKTPASPVQTAEEAPAEQEIASAETEAEQVDAAISPAPEVQGADQADAAAPAEVGAGGPANETAVAALSTNDASEGKAEETVTVPAVSLSDGQHFIETLVDPVDEGGEMVVFKFQLSKPAARPLVVLYAATEASAKAGEDFEAKSGVITFSTGSSYAEVEVPIIDDDQGEGSEEFNLFLSGDPETIAFSERQIAVTITDND